MPVDLTCPNCGEHNLDNWRRAPEPRDCRMSDLAEAHRRRSAGEADAGRAEPGRGAACAPASIVCPACNTERPGPGDN
ncbi:MAG: hypothetical protein R6X12_01385 [bacterium]